jgi:hypothetical protein
LLRRVANGEAIDEESVRGLAATVVVRSEVALALQVLAGGAHILDRAIELAAAVVGTAQAISVDESETDLRPASGARSKPTGRA